MTQKRLYGWKEIGGLLGFSGTTAKRKAKKEKLPVWYIGVRPVADPDELLKWWDKHKRKTPA